jgi:hypothetical protein
MKLRFLTVLLGLISLAMISHAQDNFVFQDLMRDTVHLEIDPSEVGSHFLGSDIALKFYRLKETYTYVEPGSYANPTARTVVSKPTIYYSLKKLNNYYKKRIRKGQLNEDEAKKKLGWYFDVGFAIFEQDTSSFEEALRAAKKPDQIEKVFSRISLEQ